MQNTLICVDWSKGRWRVTEAGPRNSIAWFDERQNAMDLAADLAASTRGSILQISTPEEETCSIEEVAANGLGPKKAGLRACLRGISRRFSTDRSSFRS